ncbi:hypothetical protein JOF56_000850 [Kibdelosporangium banguiense]|uniref:DNA-binding phage zinc finger domain-containing protein n=1 Tax=Kibdelosporangium banguiense TaxID=1365924 RepID=A0ABS4T8N7_9PSEU|nr:hypothetical protein [Kibdelosporangium banguiense]MBP2320465.1 hypothetical protein [Kibdelosporangium banguiense]
MTAPSISRDEVIVLLRGVRPPDAGPPPDAIVGAWLDRLQGYSLGECEAAVLAMGPMARTATPSVIAGSIDNARDRTTRTAMESPGTGTPTATVTSLPGWQRQAQRDRHRKAGWRGIQAVYAAMGWHRDSTVDAARMWRCPFCHAAPGELCGPLSRNRAGHHEPRDRKTLMHPSRLTAGQTSETTR